MMLVLVARLVLSLWVLGAFIITAIRASHYMFADNNNWKKPTFDFFNELWVIVLWPLALLSKNGRGMLIPNQIPHEERVARRQINGFKMPLSQKDI